MFRAYTRIFLRTHWHKDSEAEGGASTCGFSNHYLVVLCLIPVKLVKEMDPLVKAVALLSTPLMR